MISRSLRYNDKNGLQQPNRSPKFAAWNAITVSTIRSSKSRVEPKPVTSLHQHHSHSAPYDSISFSHKSTSFGDKNEVGERTVHERLETLTMGSQEDHKGRDFGHHATSELSEHDIDDAILGLKELTFGAGTSKNAKTGDDPSRPTKSNKLDHNTQAFACPFLKHDQEKYRTWKSCAWSGWPSVHRVKEHVHRKHAMPKYMCNRCGEDLKSTARLLEHQRDNISCPVKPQLHDRITQEQSERLKSRKRVHGEDNMSEEEKWDQMYSILFPNDPVPSPYHHSSTSYPNEHPMLANYGHRLLQEWGDYASCEVPKLLRPKLDVMLAGIAVETLERCEIIDLVQDTIQQTLRGFNHTRMAPLVEDHLGAKEEPKQDEFAPEVLNVEAPPSLDTDLNRVDETGLDYVVVPNGLSYMDMLFEDTIDGADNFQFLLDHQDTLSFQGDDQVFLDQPRQGQNQKS